MHSWGDSWFEKHENEFHNLVEDTYRWARRYRLGGQIKEKFGTLRFYAGFHYQIHDLFYPGYCRIVWPRFMNWLDLRIYCRYFNFVRRAIVHIQMKLYAKLYVDLVKKYPQFTKEILTSADHKELFPLALQRIANEGWHQSPEIGEVLYDKNFKNELIVLAIFDKTVSFALPNGNVLNMPLKKAAKRYVRWNGLGI